MRRTGFARPVYTPPPPAPLRPATRRASYAGTVTLRLVPKDEPVRSEPYRRLVAARPCIACGIHGYSQAAHVPPDGKGIKQDDRLTFPLCATRPGVTGCHVEFDQWRMFPRADAVAMGLRWAADTRAEIEAEGTWPARLPRWIE